MIVKSRFFIDHGVVHDRLTGQHVGMEAEPGNPERLLTLLRELEGYRPVTLHVDNTTLARQIAADPDDEPEAEDSFSRLNQALEEIRVNGIDVGRAEPHAEDSPK